MTKRKGVKKKNNLSKHILKAREDDVTAASDANDKTVTSREKRKSKSNGHTKHPEEAAHYLTQWKASKSEDPSIKSSSSWKFNKNTQSWLIRHMYEVDKVSKTTFFLLLEYLEGLEGESIIDRMRINASQRCRRHKEYCKSNTSASTKEIEEETIDEIDNIRDINENDLEKGNNAKSTMAANTTAERKAELEHEEALWRRMNDHDKRKQYKRARKILDLIKKGSE